jgi:hypothetical protein
VSKDLRRCVSSGFIPNVGVTDTAHVYIANGIGGMRFLPALAQASGIFRVYCHMAEQPDNVLQGDVWMTDAMDVSKLCGVMTDVKFKKLRSDIFHRLMKDHAVAPAPGHAHSKKPAPVRASKPVVPVAATVAPVAKPEETLAKLHPGTVDVGHHGTFRDPLVFVKCVY